MWSQKLLKLLQCNLLHTCCTIIQKGRSSPITPTFIQPSTKWQNFWCEQIESICRWQNKCCWNDSLSLSDRVEKIVEEGENAGYHHFILFPQCFQSPLFQGHLKSGLCGKELSPPLFYLQFRFELYFHHHFSSSNENSWAFCPLTALIYFSRQSESAPSE